MGEKMVCDYFKECCLFIKDTMALDAKAAEEKLMTIPAELESLAPYMATVILPMIAAPEVM